jgi:hypothetical protein
MANQSPLGVLFPKPSNLRASLLQPNVLPNVEPLVPAPSATQKIHDSVPDDVKRLLQKFLSILRTSDVMPTPPHGVEHHIHTGSHSPVFAKSHRLEPKKMQKRNSKVWNQLAFSPVQNHHGPLPCTRCLKKMDPGDFVAITAVSIW